MPERQFNLKALLDRVKDLSWEDIGREVTRSHQAAFGYIARGKRKPLHDLAAAYHQETGRLLFFMHDGRIKPGGISGEEIALYRDFFGHLVSRGVFKETVLAVLATWKGEGPEDLLDG